MRQPSARRARRLWVVLLLLFGLLAPSVAAAAPPQWAGAKADMILFDGKVVTVNEDFDIASAVAIRNGRIQAVGDFGEVMRHAGPETHRVNLRGRTVIPGLIDSHLHQLRAALDIPNVSLLEARSIADVVAAIEARVQQTAAGDWVIASALWHESLLEEGRMPTRFELDPVSPDNPVFIPRGGHVATVNSRALELAGIDASTPNPPGGVIVRNDAGEPTGVLLETARDLVESHLPPPPPVAEQKRLLRQKMAELNALGITGVTEPGLSDSAIALYEDLWRDGDLTVRTHMLYGVFTRGVEGIKHAVQLFSTDFGDDMLRFDGAKFLLDGGVEGARLYDPYRIVPGEQPDPEYRGVLLLPPDGTDGLVDAYRIAAEHGWQVQTHGVGDETIDVMVNAYYQVDGERDLTPLRWVVMHIFLPTQPAISLMLQMDILATVQDHPTLLGHNQLRWWGEPRASFAIPLRTLLDAGLIVGGGSDAPVVPANPFLSLWWMVTRDTLTAGVLGADQAISREEALRLYTNHSAYTQFVEDRQGSIEVGKLADLVVLSDDYLTVPEDRIKDIQAEMTIVGGEIVHSRD